MKKSKKPLELAHSPSPWNLQDELTIVAADGYSVASIPDGDGSFGERPEQDHINAKLMAAAPSMYRALKALMDPTVPDAIAHTLIRAAIKKAENGNG